MNTDGQRRRGDCVKQAITEPDKLILPHGGCDHSPWSFDAILVACLPKLNEEQGALARKLAAAILDKTKLTELNADPTWRLVQPIPLDTPWPDESM